MFLTLCFEILRIILPTWTYPLWIFGNISKTRPLFRREIFTGWLYYTYRRYTVKNNQTGSKTKSLSFHKNDPFPTFQCRLTGPSYSPSPWTRCGSASEEHLNWSDLTLEDDATYSLSVRAVNHADLISQAITQNVTVETSRPASQGMYVICSTFKWSTVSRRRTEFAFYTIVATYSEWSFFLLHFDFFVQYNWVCAFVSEIRYQLIYILTWILYFYNGYDIYLFYYQCINFPSVNYYIFSLNNLYIFLKIVFFLNIYLKLCLSGFEFVFFKMTVVLFIIVMI